MNRQTLLAALKANPALPFMLIWQLAFRVPIKIAIHDWWGLCDVFTISAMALLALVYLVRLVSVPGPEKIERHIRMPKPYLDDAMRRAVERMVRDVQRRMDGRLK